MSRELEYVLGYRVISVDDSPEDGWRVNLEGETALRYTGNVVAPGSEIEGTTLGKVELGSEQDEVEFFSGAPAENIYTLTVPKGALTIEWGESTKPTIVDRGDPADDLPDDPSRERLLSGPLENAEE